MARLEHVNVTVSNAEQTAELLCKLFDWHIRWSGPAKLGGRTVHVGNDSDYLAIYTSAREPQQSTDAGSFRGGLNHIGVLVDDLQAAEARVRAAGLEPFNHMTYDPGSRFYFLDPDGVEYEVISYSG